MTASNEPDRDGSYDPVGAPAGGRREVAGYVLAVFVLVVVGAVVRTTILNWIVGPAVVIASVWLTTMGRDRAAGR